MMWRRAMRQKTVLRIRKVVENFYVASDIYVCSLFPTLTNCFSCACNDCGAVQPQLVHVLGESCLVKPKKNNF